MISDYARGKRNPTLRTIEALAKALDREPWQLLKGPKPGEGLPTEDESRRENIAWFSRFSPTQKIMAIEQDKAAREYLSAFRIRSPRREA